MPRKDPKPQEPTESLIAESYILRLGLDPCDILDPHPMPTESDAIRGTLRGIVAAPKETIVRFRGRDHVFVPRHEMNPTKGTQIFSSGDGVHDRSIRAQIVLAPKAKLNQHIYVKYNLKKNSKWEPGHPAYFLESEGNPTTIFAGNNVVPVTTEDPKTGAIEPLPSSSHRSMLTVNRAPFELLKALDRAISGEKATYDPERTKAIGRGDFELVRTQFCCYLPTPNVRQFLQLLEILYTPEVTDGEKRINIADHLGLKVRQFKDKAKRITGIQFQWRHGAKLVASLVFYNKQRQVARMRQGKTLEEKEKSLVAENVRFDITLHKRGIQQLISGAQKELEKKRRVSPDFLKGFPAKFIEDKPLPTMWWFEHAVEVMASSTSNGQAKRNSFSDWLVSRALDDMLRIRSIVKCTPAALQAFAGLNEPVVTAWLKADKFEAGSWAKQIMEISGLKKTPVYEHRKRLFGAYGIDIAVPYPFYRDLVYDGPRSIAKSDNRAAMNKALGKAGSKDEVWRLLQENITDFFAQLVNVVGTTVSSRPVPLPMKVIGRISEFAADTAVGEPAIALAPDKPRSPSASKARSAKKGTATPASKRRSGERTGRGH